MAEGRSNQGICRALWLSPKTVETHIRGAFAKLGIREAPEDNRRVLAVLPTFGDSKGTGAAPNRRQRRGVPIGVPARIRHPQNAAACCDEDPGRSQIPAASRHVLQQSPAGLSIPTPLLQRAAT